MRTFEKDYEYLLRNLIPHHRLSPARRKQIDRAMGGGSPGDVRRASVLALEELCRAEYFERRPVEPRRGTVLLTYVRNNGLYQIKLQLPVEQWRALGLEVPNGVSGGASAALREDNVSESTVAILPDIIRSFSINDHRGSMLDRLEVVIARMCPWLGIADGRLVVVEERVEDRSGGGKRVSIEPTRALVRNPAYERCRRAREIELLEPAGARALGIAVPNGEMGEGATGEVAVAPVYVLGEFWGVFECWLPGAARGGTAQGRVATVVKMIEQIITNAARLRTLTSVDKLTQVYNRQFYDKQVQIEIERATRSGGKLSILVLDLDDFKRINDEMGHQKGDEVLALVAELIKANLRKIDLAFRYGGEEFVVLLPGTTEVEAIHTAERLRAVIEETDRFQGPDGRSIGIRVSIGAAVFPDHARSAEELFSKADAALYRAKRKGKNRVEFYRV